MVDKLFEAAQTFDKLDEEATEKYKMGDPSDRSLEDSDFWINQSENAKMHKQHRLSNIRGTDRTEVATWSNSKIQVPRSKGTR
jgi:hypothetical protein